MIGTRPAACLTTTSSTVGPLVLLEPGHLAGDAERRQAVGPLLDEEVDDAPLAGLVEIPGIGKCRRDNGIHALECHKDQKSYCR